MSAINLDGIWSFGFAEGGSETPLDIPLDGVIAVPGCFDGDGNLFGHEGTGVFQRTVTCGGRVRLSFSGGLHIAVYWDGTRVGGSVLAYTLEHYEFDAGAFGIHELTVVIDNLATMETSEVFKEYYDFYGHGGIYSHVELEEVAAEGIGHIQVTPLDYTSGEVEIALDFPDQAAVANIAVAFDQGESVRMAYSAPVRLKVPDFRLWSPEAPHLHTVTVTRNGDSRTATFGIRTLEWHGGELRLNGRKLRLMGYCRHESHPEFGASTPLSLIRGDLEMMKRQGCNFIRGCHYPQREDMLDLCDRMGMLVWDETLGWDCEMEVMVDPLFQERQEEEMVKMIRNSGNHPSVIIWGFLNENRSEHVENRVLVKRLMDVIHRVDPSRPGTFASNRTVKDACLDLLDIISFNTYPGWYDPGMTVNGIPFVEPKLTREIAFTDSGEYADKPVIISEIGGGAMLGDHSGVRWSEDYQAELMTEVIRVVFGNPRVTGLSIWQFCNNRTYIKGSLTHGRPCGFNNKGLLTEYRQPKMAWNAVTKAIKNLQLYV